MKGFCLDVSGDFACFTRPEMKVERVSYDVITPSAARGIFTAIFWKPAIRWRITRIEVLSPIRWTSVRRNEVSAVAFPRAEGIYIEDTRTQRAGLILRDVRYRLFAEFDYLPPSRRTPSANPAPSWLADAAETDLHRQAEAARPDEKPAKYAAMFDRRATRGQYFMHPYLGCREFSVRECRLVKDPDAPGEPRPIPETRDLGLMLYDLDYTDPANIRPLFYRPRMTDGVIPVPPPGSPEVLA